MRPVKTVTFDYWEVYDDISDTKSVTSGYSWDGPMQNLTEALDDPLAEFLDAAQYAPGDRREQAARILESVARAVRRVKE